MEPELLGRLSKFLRPGAAQKQDTFENLSSILVNHRGASYRVKTSLFSIKTSSLNLNSIFYGNSIVSQTNI